MTMPREIKTITLPLPYRMGTVNCYLVGTGSGFVLIDTGPAHSRAELEGELAAAGCRPGNLALILLTHGDFDHTGNAAYLRGKYRARLAMHRDDLGMVERGDMFFNRSSGNAILRLLSPLLYRFGKGSRFVPDAFVEEGEGLAEHGWQARILSLPGHSRGSIGFLTTEGDLFCGDLLENTQGPALGSIMDEPATAEASLEKLARLEIRTVYPGHGRPFAMEALLGNA
jgi:hydroxyacylglutathione hydrolase